MFQIYHDGRSRLSLNEGAETLTERYLFTSESVAEGHPDKLCDQISDAIVDAVLSADPQGRVGAECSVTTDLLMVTGEISTTAKLDIEKIARNTIRGIGYTGISDYGFDADTCRVTVAIKQQSSDIAGGVFKSAATEDELEKLGAGDQGMMFGFACDETSELMPLPISAAHRLAQRLDEVRKTKLLPYLRPDGKTQCTIEYEGMKPVRVDTIVVSASHDPIINGIDDNEQIQKLIASDIKAQVIDPVFEKFSIKPDSSTRYFINPAGRYVIGGPHSDAGLTGRKIIVDTYGGYARHGGGAFSGKDPTKVDRSGAYAARYVAKNIVAAGLASACEVQVAYAIGVARPVSLHITTFNTGIVKEADLISAINKNFDMRPAAIISKFKLRELPKLHDGNFYRKIAAYGHFGRNDIELPWEKLDLAPLLKQALAQPATAQ
jgi:S-adenosylmethionine synthetase